MFDPNLLRAVAKISSADDRRHGTGFLYDAPTPTNESKVGTWFVTCKHVYEGIREDGDKALIWFNRNDGTGAVPMEVDVSGTEGNWLWTLHDEHDVAVLAFYALKDNPVREMIAFSTFPRIEHSLASLEAQEIGVSEGDGVYILGFPVGWEPSDRHYPVTRYGVIAQIRGLYDGSHSTFLVDGSVFGGNSGSPVLTKFEVAGIQGLPVVPSTKLIGMVNAYKVNQAPVDEVSEQQALSRIIAIENADLITVIPIDHIDETVGMACQKYGIT
ncbi:S1 family peptidase [Candidatus Poriferisocius sp.]|uniref:S1 family peptidase n=1 Tax=Candidatus Poriferisocius sp. TaxID=3101276 RepID=UPI003B0123C8